MPCSRNTKSPPLDREGFRRAFRLPYREFYAEQLPDIPLEELEAHFRPAFDAAVTPVTVLPHAREKLEWCSALGIRAFVLTSMDTLAFERQMDDFGLRHHFEATYSGVLDKREVIHRILETHDLNPAETAFVGDMTHDVETARHGGISSIAVLTGYNHAEILAAVRPDITVPDLGVLRGLLDRRRSVSRPIATVGALIHDGNGHVLMVRTHKWGDRWGIPGGKIERGESSTHAWDAKSSKKPAWPSATSSSPSSRIASTRPSSCAPSISSSSTTSPAPPPPPSPSTTRPRNSAGSPRPTRSPSTSTSRPASS